MRKKFVSEKPKLLEETRIYIISYLKPVLYFYLSYVLRVNTNEK